MNDTIVALSSGRPPAAIGIVRMSGPDAIVAATIVAGSLPPPRVAGVRAVRDADGGLLDRALMLVFPGPRSATGEDLVEFHCHGGRAVVAAVERRLIAIQGCRAALPGEFTRRALANGRIDLAEAEGLADLLEAETEGQRIAALAAAEGVVSRHVAAWMTAISAISARIEVMIDHDEEDDVEGGEAAIASVVADAAMLGEEIAAAIAAPPVERLRDGLRVVLAGPPNAGKSTLLNLLGEREAAIVSPIAGTTRDMIEVPVIRNGRAYVLTDTAGLTESDDAIEMIGVDRASEAMTTADILLWLGDEAAPRSDAIRLHARADVGGREVVPEGRMAVRRDDLRTVAAVWDAVHAIAERLLPRADAIPWRTRHRALCGIAADALMRRDRDPLLLAENCRVARTCMGEIVGVDATEAMLDALFCRFCLGK